MNIFIAHTIRKTHESSNMIKVFNTIDKANTAVLTIDFKMKLMSLKWQESMVEFFGKRGICVFGQGWTRYKTQEELRLEESKRARRLKVEE
jgi:hypothetical protein